MSSSAPGVPISSTGDRPTGRPGNGRVVLVGERYEIDHAMQHPSLSSAGEFTVVGTVPTVSGAGGFPEQIIRSLVRLHHADTIVVASPMSRSSRTLFGELAVVLGCRLLLLVSKPNDPAPRLLPVWDVTPSGGSAVLSTSRARFDQAKRNVDVVLASLGLLVALPVIAVAALAVRLDSPGGAFFGHVRIGRGGQRFRCWKLRTMYLDAEQRLEQEEELLAVYRANDFKLPDDKDPRITRIGRFLRKSSLDELPQLLNVWRGDMSLVGPRPIVAEELPHYRGEILTLLSVRPGVTGAWAVNGRHHLPYPERAEVELGYVRSRSFGTDLTILLRTIGAVLDPGFGRRAAALRVPVVTPPPVAAPLPVTESTGRRALG